MGAWGTAIFSNDDACDVRDEYREMIVMAVPDEVAEQRIIELNQERIKFCPNDFWLPLAMTQWKVGRLSELVQGNALASIQRELEELDSIWEPKQIKKRREALLRAKDQLCSPMPPRKKLQMPSWACRCPWEAGNVIQYRHTKPDENFGAYVLLQIIGVSKTPPHKIPLDCIGISPYAWYSKSVPSEEEVLALKEKIKLIPFSSVRWTGVAPYCAILPSPEMIKDHDMKLVSAEPLATNYEAVPDFIPTPHHSTLEMGVENILSNFENASQKKYAIPPDWRRKNFPPNNRLT